MKHIINNEPWYPWTDIENGRYEYYEKRFGKITRKRLFELAQEGLIRTREVPVKGTPYTYTVYNEHDIIVSFGKYRFRQKVEWFK